MLAPNRALAAGPCKQQLRSAAHAKQLLCPAGLSRQRHGVIRRATEDDQQPQQPGWCTLRHPPPPYHHHHQLASCYARCDPSWHARNAALVVRTAMTTISSVAKPAAVQQVTLLHAITTHCRCQNDSIGAYQHRCMLHNANTLSSITAAPAITLADTSSNAVCCRSPYH
jgi:hypothetical protein